MRISVVSHGDPTRDPHVRALIASLVSAGHDVAVVCGSTPRGRLPDAHVIDASREGGPPSHIQRFTPRLVRERRRKGALRTAVATTEPDLVYPAGAADIDLVAGLGTPVVRRPSWPDVPLDLVRIAPHDTFLSSSAAGPPAPFHQPGDDRPGSKPAPGRHTGMRIAVAARFTATNPSRYLVSALERAGVDVVKCDGGVEPDRIPADVAGVVIVESPLPPIETHTPLPDVPVLFWVHHGEHHLAANLRLTRRYGSHAVLLAHSWHLAHRFPVPVHRFPFAVAPELFSKPTPFAERTLDVAMVGAGLGDAAVRYGRRQQLAASLEAALPGRTAFRSDVQPQDLAAIYGDARIVVNDGGDRHFPITMRVFETLGAGALLLTDDLPGTDVLLAPGRHYVATGEDPVGQVRALLSDPATAAIASAGHDQATAHHTYDHRVDELVSILSVTRPGRATPEAAATDVLSATIDGDVEVHSIAAFGVELDLPDRVVRYDADARNRLTPGKTDAVVVGPAEVGDLDRVLAAARRYVYATGPAAALVRGRLPLIHAGAVVSQLGPVMRADLGAPGYRIPVGGTPETRVT